MSFVYKSWWKIWANIRQIHLHRYTYICIYICWFLLSISHIFACVNTCTLRHAKRFSRPSLLRARLSTNTHTHTHMYLYKYLGVYVNMNCNRFFWAKLSSIEPVSQRSTENGMSKFCCYNTNYEMSREIESWMTSCE